MSKTTNGNKSAKPNIRLTDSILKELKKNKACVRALEDLHEKSFYTVQGWLRQNDPQLCRHDSLLVIGAYLKKDTDELVEYPNGVALIDQI